MVLSDAADLKAILNREKRKGLKLHKLTFHNHDEFIAFYQHIQIAKGPLFESSLTNHASSKWSFFSILPKATIFKTRDEIFSTTTNQKNHHSVCFFDQLNSIKFQTSKKYPELTPFPFIGGFMGFLSYENIFETKSALKEKQQSFPLYQFSLFMNTFLFDLENRESHLIYNEDFVLAAYNVWLQKKKIKKKSQPLNKILLRPQISKTQYLNKIEKIFEHIKKGDIYQANFTHKFIGQFNGEPFEVYNSLRKKNPSPFSCFYEVDNQKFILCSSPERLFKVENGKILSSPIKGTIKRDTDQMKDLKLQQELLNSHKDSAELAMIIDLIRNDLGKISNFGTVKVLNFKKLESFQKVHHLIGTIEGQLKPKTSVKDIFSAIFPGGSISGAPKIRSIEILNELEDEARGPYTGSMGYIDIRGNMDFNIMIRTILIENNSISLQVGGGIVIDSDPVKEYEESLHKAQALFDALSYSHT